MKISSVGAEFFHADGRKNRRNTNRRTEGTKLIVAFRNFGNAPKSCYIILGLIVITIILKMPLTQSCTSFYISLLHHFNKGFLIIFSQLYFKQYSATRSNCFPQPHYVHSQVTIREPKRICLTFTPYTWLLVEPSNVMFCNKKQYLYHHVAYKSSTVATRQ